MTIINKKVNASFFYKYVKSNSNLFRNNLKEELKGD